MRHLLIIALLAATLLALAVWREARSSEPHPLPLAFAHADHDTVNCVACHHEFVDATPRGPCIECHLGDPQLQASIQQHFHDLCRDCHLADQRAGRPAGPARACQGCHLQNDAP